MSCSTFTATPIGGKILEASGNEYWGLIVFTIASYAASFICLVVAKRIACGKGFIWVRF